MAEHGLTTPVIGVTFDGTGYGTDGAVWGGEFLVGDYQSFRRAAHLRYVGLPGGDGAIRQPWRMALAHLMDAEATMPASWAWGSSKEWATVQRMVERRINTPWTSSAGRLFDAVAALAGVRGQASYEGQAAMELEWLARSVPEAGSYPFNLMTLPEGSPPQPTCVIDTRPLIAAVADDARAGVEPAVIGRRFHTSLVDIIAQVCCRLRAETGLTTVVLSGGVFMNVLLTSEVCVRLSEEGFDTYRHLLVPPNDGGLSLGQLAVASAHGDMLNLSASSRRISKMR
jgi:hydrogenase maturation protein HypF